MSFYDFETSIDTAQPIELYEFTYGINKHRYCTAPDTIVYGGYEWLSSQISRQTILVGGNTRTTQLILNVPRDFYIAQQFKSSQPATHIYIKIYKLHRTDTAQEAIIEWVGRVMSAKWGNSGATITCESVYASIERNARIRRYSITCPFQLYGEGCKVSMTNYGVDATLSSVSGITLVSDAFATKPNGWFIGGFVLWYDVVNKLHFRRFITAHSGNQITIQQQINGLIAGEQIKAYAGCNKLITTCKDKFNNIENYGGFPWTPSKNPFLSDSNVFW